MIKNEYNVIGVMSGTSLDGIDLALMTFKLEDVWSFKIHHSETIEYNNKWSTQLRNLVSFSMDELRCIDVEYTSYLSKIINSFIKRNSITNIDAVCSHGHTALHQPKNQLTYQIGNLSNLAQLVNKTVVCDFRVNDIKLGGQGAPLVPIGDALLFSEYDFCLNLGGFANISFEDKNERIAFDICPVNIVLNHYMKQLGYDYDNKGNIALSGTINYNLLNKLNALEFYKKDYPKSLGLEWVNNTIFPLINSDAFEVKDILRTFVEHIAIQISSKINNKNNASVLVTGGGVFNSFLIEKIQSLTKNRIVIPSNEIIDYKEALIFGFLGVLKLRNEVNCLASVTGAKHNHSTGKIYLP